ncbi:THAP domain-containing protein 3 isoform X1 [Hylobates moloch]|uniref:THAP domain-containing protein 3 isoform X1 n=1 Tax=Hylobates moloch TaxID=81572 RepID=UPI0013F24EDA|nr:THAP domain-containing protein 3 isoform X1 [Hylobates moloch]XP_058299967.1 THAP domain-containing protein 3 isoform X1 [Hylobates moloch]
MPKSCAARQCCNRYSSRRKQLTFHRFPFSRPELLKEWVLNIGRGNFKPKQHTVICSEHFRPECFSAFGNRKNLKHNAVPTVFAFQDPTQQVRENTDPASERGNASSSQKEKVLSEAGAREDSPGRNMDTALEELQLPPNAEGPVKQVRLSAKVVCGWTQDDLLQARWKPVSTHRETGVAEAGCAAWVSELPKFSTMVWAHLDFGTAARSVQLPWGCAGCVSGGLLTMAHLLLVMQLSFLTPLSSGLTTEAASNRGCWPADWPCRPEKAPQQAAI